MMWLGVDLTSYYLEFNELFELILFRVQQALGRAD